MNKLLKIVLILPAAIIVPLLPIVGLGVLAARQSKPPAAPLQPTRLPEAKPEAERGLGDTASPREDFTRWRLCVEKAGIPSLNPPRLDVSDGAVYSGTFPALKGAYSVQVDKQERIVQVAVLMSGASSPDNVRVLAKIYSAMGECLTGSSAPSALTKSDTVEAGGAKWSKRLQGAGVVLTVEKS